MNEVIGIVFFGIGVAFNFFGCLGLVRFPDIYNRLQAGTKCVTFGTIFILLGVLIYSGFTSLGIKAVLCLVFILLTSPTAAHAISKGAHRSGVRLWKESIIDRYREEVKPVEGEKADA
ncbi:MAG: Na+/H+ antiporter subunit G [Spirochaetes bacterium]|nr:MAG: Na+/H+ antiporter subunit G [Spirochaetota bacterium]